MKIAISSQPLAEFYGAYMGLNRPEGWERNNAMGLCHNLEEWWDVAYPPTNNASACEFLENVLDFRVVHREMVDQFEQAGLFWAFPFNQDVGDFFSEFSNSKCHLNQERRQWVIDRITDYLIGDANE